MTVGSETGAGDGTRGRLRHYEARRIRRRGTRGYSSFVGFMRYAMPLSAVVLLSLVVVWPLMTGREEGFRIEFTDRDTIDATPRMINARYLGMDERNQPFTVTAAEAVQPDPDSQLIHLRDITADMFVENSQAEWLAVTANRGVYEQDTQLLDLRGAVSLFSDAGHEFHTESAHVDLNAGIAEGDEPIAGQGPFGLIDAGNFRLVENGETLYFGGTVKLVIFPGTSNER